MTVRFTALRYAAMALAVVWTVPVATQERPGRSLLTIDPPDSTDTRPFGISDAGDVVGLYIATDNRVRGFLLTDGAYTAIDVPGSIRTNALGVAVLRPSADGGASRSLAIVGRYDTPDTVAHGYVLRDGVMTTIDHPDATTFTVATGINTAGHIVGRYLGSDGFFHGFTLVEGEFTTVDYPGARSIHAMGINASDDIAGYYENFDGTFHGFLLSDGVFTTVDPPGSLATGVAGGIVGLNAREMVGMYRVNPATSGCGCNGTRGFIYKNGVFESFDFPAAISTALTGVNGPGDIVGNYQDAAGRRHGLLLRLGNDSSSR